MKVTIQSFYSSFYGKMFARYFRRIPDIDQPKICKQFIVKDPKELYLHVHKNSGIHPCYISVHDNGSADDLKCNDKNNLIFDRVFFDFDAKNDEAEHIKKILINLRRNGPHYNKGKQTHLQTQLKNLVINNEISKNAVDDAKKFSKIFQRDFGKKPALFFSGFKGCHAYVFFEPFEPTQPNKTVYYFAENLKKSYALDSMDLAVNKDAISRVSRIPYSKHQLTDLSVVPFDVTDDYNEIVRKSLSPKVQPFHIDNHLTELNNHLKNIDKILCHNSNIKAESNIESGINYPKSISYSKSLDTRLLFKQIVGEPVKEYENYNMYRCPFPDHDDVTPSFMVHQKGYKCYGCDKKGNYWQFLKDYKGWTDLQVRNYLKSK